MNKASAIGIDIGSTTWKAVVIDQEGEIITSLVEPSDPLIEAQTDRAVAILKEKAGVDGDIPIAATGYGRKRVEATRILTEITCHAKGAFHNIKDAGVLIDIGGQDTKIIHIGKNGTVDDFHMNDKCAAGTGRFLEVILARLNVPVDEIADRVNSSTNPIMISSTCTVFAESEVVSLVAQGKEINDIVSGLHLSLSTRIASLAGNLANDTKVFMSGGVALNAAMVKSLSETVKHTVNVLPEPQLVGALGAALAVNKS